MCKYILNRIQRANKIRQVMELFYCFIVYMEFESI